MTNGPGFRVHGHLGHHQRGLAPRDGELRVEGRGPGPPGPLGGQRALRRALAALPTAVAVAGASPRAHFRHLVENGGLAWGGRGGGVAGARVGVGSHAVVRVREFGGCENEFVLQTLGGNAPV